MTNQLIGTRIKALRQVQGLSQGELARLFGFKDRQTVSAIETGLMTTGVKDALVAHASGNLRALAIMADGLLAAAAEHDRDILDAKLFIETWGEPAQPTATRR